MTSLYRTVFRNSSESDMGASRVFKHILCRPTFSLGLEVGPGDVVKKMYQDVFLISRY